jgi:hypothetical protein
LTSAAVGTRFWSAVLNHEIIQTGNSRKSDVRFIAPQVRVLWVGYITASLLVAEGLPVLYRLIVDSCTGGSEALLLIKEKAHDLFS